VKHDKFKWDIDKLMVNSIYRIWIKLYHQTNDKYCQVKQHEIDWDIAELMMNPIYRISVSHVIKQTWG